MQSNKPNPFPMRETKVTRKVAPLGYDRKPLAIAGTATATRIDSGSGPDAR